MGDDTVHLEKLFHIRSQSISPTTSNDDSAWSLHSGENHMFWIKIHSGLTVLFTTSAVLQLFLLSFNWLRSCRLTECCHKPLLH